MRKRLTLITFLFLLSIGFSSADETRTITVLADEWCPYNCVPGSDQEGFGIEFLRAIYEPLGIKVDYRLKSWDEAVSDTRKGLYDAVISAYKSDAVGFIFPENPYAYSISCFFVKSSNDWIYNGIDSLKFQKIGVISGYSYGKHIDEFIETNREAHIYMVKGNRPLNALFKALENDKVTAVLEDEAVFRFKHKSEFPGIEIREAGCQHPGSLYIAFSPAMPDSKLYAEMFDRGLIELRRSGKYREILKSYNLEKYY